MLAGRLSPGVWLTRRRGADHDDLGIGRRRIRPHPISSATLFSKIMIANAGRNAVNSSNQFWPRARSGAKPFRIVTAINKISSGASRPTRYTSAAAPATASCAGRGPTRQPFRSPAR
jgi:hypothetical protein